VVAAWRLRVGIGRKGVSIIPSENYEGMVDAKRGFTGALDCIPSDLGGVPDPPLAMRRGVENHIIVSLAGEAAQRRFRPSSVRSYHGRHDRNGVVYMLGCIASDRQFTAYCKWLKIRAEEFVDDDHWWAAIKAVAKALMERERLSAEEVGEVIRNGLRADIESRISAQRIRAAELGSGHKEQPPG
jgi:hypothetical protein